MKLNEKMNLRAGVVLSAAKERRSYWCQFVQAGKVRTSGGGKSDFEIDPIALMSGYVKGVFSDKAVFMDHAGFFDYPSLDKLVGVTSNVIFDDETDSIKGSITLYDTQSGETMGELIDAILEDKTQGLAVPDIGISLVFYPVWEKDSEGKRTSKIVDIKHVESIDFVFEPAAEGRFLEALSTAHAVDIRTGELEAHLPAASASIEGTDDSVIGDHGYKRSKYGGLVMAKLAEEMAEEMNLTSPESDGIKPIYKVEEGAGLAQDWIDAIGETAAEAMITSSSLPAASKERLLLNRYSTPDQVRGAIEAERTFLAKLAEDQVVQIGGSPPRGGQISVGRSSLDQIEAAFEALLMGVRPPDDVRPLTGIRELYHLLSGDYEMNGLFQPERVQFANVTCSTMSNLVANALNKIIMAEFQQYPQWWSPIVAQMDFASLQAIRWMTLGGVGELPTVAEGAAYTELTWDDKYETSTFIKKGGYLGITIEAIDKDDTGRISAAPRALAQAAWLTLNKSVSAIFTDAAGLGPTLIDTGTLFNATAVATPGGHANLGTTALSTTEWAVVRNLMRKQAELNSGERLGALTAPKYLLVPPDLESTALKVLASGEDYLYALANAPSGPINPFAEGVDRMERLRSARERVIVVDLWTDVNNWAAIADPQLYPTIGLGFRYGRVPEIFSVASPTAGLMFTNDTMPVKVRFFYAVGPVDWRGMYKENVA